jgi:hypothetical protein
LHRKDLVKYVRAMPNGAELNAGEVAAIAAGVALIPAAASAFWAGRQSGSAQRSATAAEGQVAQARKQVVVAKAQAGLARAAAETAEEHLLATQHSVKIAEDALGSSRDVALGQLLLTFDELLLQYVDVHTRLHPSSPDSAWTLRDPPSPHEQIRIETYMGLFERLFILIDRETVPVDIAHRFYEYRVGNLVHNEWVLERKLREKARGWSEFLALCDRFGIDVSGSH